MLNPFVVGAYISPEFFCGRSKETKVLEECIRERKNVVLHSARRLGKTHLIEHVFRRASFKEEFGCLCVDAGVCGSLNEFAFVLINGIFRSLTRDRSNFDKFAGLCRRLGLSMTMGSSSEVVLPSFSLVWMREPEKVIEESFSFLEDFDKKVVLAIDSFEKLASFKDVNGARALGKIIESHSSVRMIFSVCETQGCSAQFLDKHRVVFRSSELIHLRPIEFSEYWSFARSKFQKAGKRISSEIFESIYSKFSGGTGPIQLVLNRLFAETPKNCSVKTEILDNVINSIVVEYSVFYKEALSRLSFNQKCLVIAVARDGSVENPSSSEFVTRHSLASVSSVQSSARALLGQSILYKDASGIRIDDDFFKEWLRKEYF
jgi:AAA+ ATPase superfamily predicted ATPase